MLEQQDTTNITAQNKKIFLTNDACHIRGIISTSKTPPETNILDLDFDKFKAYLERQNLSERSVYLYLNYHKRMLEVLRETEQSISQEVVDAYLDSWNFIPSRAYLKQLLSFLKNKEIEIPKLTGRKPRKKPRIMSLEEREKVSSYLYKWNLKYGLIFDLTDECGLRRGESVGFHIEDFDWESWKLDPTRSCRLMVVGKGNKEREVIVSPKIMQGILFYLKEVKQSPDQPFFKMGYSRWDLIFRKACQESLGKTYKLHEIRHTRATEWYREGKDIMQIKNRLGHASVGTTQLYINPSEEDELNKWEQEVEEEKD